MNRELLCENCIHKEVCSLKEIYRNAQFAVERVSVPLSNKENATDLKNLSWIKPVQLECNHHYANNFARTKG